MSKKNIKYKPFFVQSKNPLNDEYEVAMKIVEELILHMMKNQEIENIKPRIE